MSQVYLLREVEKNPKCTYFNCIKARRSTLGRAGQKLWLWPSDDNDFDGDDDAIKCRRGWWQVWYGVCNGQPASGRASGQRWHTALCPTSSSKKTGQRQGILPNSKTELPSMGWATISFLVHCHLSRYAREHQCKKYYLSEKFFFGENGCVFPPSVYKRLGFVINRSFPRLSNKPKSKSGSGRVGQQHLLI